MPSERSSASAITGLNALRTKARSISLQTCIRPFCRTESVIGSGVCTALILFPSEADEKVADRIDGDPVARLDHRRAVELLDDRRPVEARRGGQALAHVDRRVAPAAVGEPH